MEACCFTVEAATAIMLRICALIRVENFMNHVLLQLGLNYGALVAEFAKFWTCLSLHQAHAACIHHHVEYLPVGSISNRQSLGCRIKLALPRGEYRAAEASVQ